MYKNKVDDYLSTEQLRSLEEYLPTPEEIALIKAYKGDPDLLGQVEKYMSVMMDFVHQAPKRIKCMIYKQSFKARVTEIKSKLSKIEGLLSYFSISLYFIHKYFI